MIYIYNLQKLSDLNEQKALEGGPDLDPSWTVTIQKEFGL